MGHTAIECNKHNSRDSNQILLNDKYEQVLVVSSVPGESAIYDCLVSIVACVFGICE